MHGLRHEGRAGVDQDRPSPVGDGRHVGEAGDEGDAGGDLGQAADVAADGVERPMSMSPRHSLSASSRTSSAMGREPTGRCSRGRLAPGPLEARRVRRRWRGPDAQLLVRLGGPPRRASGPHAEPARHRRTGRVAGGSGGAVARSVLAATTVVTSATAGSGGYRVSVARRTHASADSSTTTIPEASGRRAGRRVPPPRRGRRRCRAWRGVSGRTVGPARGDRGP